MDMYGHDFSLFDFGFSDPTMYDSLSRNSSAFSSYSTTTIDDEDSGKRSAKRTTSPPKHRHDGTSPLPLGMDWSPPPRRWDGRDSIWPHDPHTGWSYCVTVPSWVILPESRGLDPLAFYRVQIGVQSPEGITTIRGILRRFSDFLKLFSELKKEFPYKSFPPTPPKKLLRMKSRTLLEERRSLLEDWMEKLLSDIDLSRSAPVAIFLELEAAARASFYDSNQHVLDANASASTMVESYQCQLNSEVSLVAERSSVTSDCDNDAAYEISNLGTPRQGRYSCSKVGLENTSSDQDFTHPSQVTSAKGMSANIDDPVIVRSNPENQETLSQHIVSFEKETSNAEKDGVSESNKALYHPGEEIMELSEPEMSPFHNLARGLSTGSGGSDLSSLKASEISNLGFATISGDNTLDLNEVAEALKTKDLLAGSITNDVLLAIPSDECGKINRVFVTMERRLATAKTDIEDLIARLHQELAVSQYLTKKVKDLEVELETTRRSGKENLQQAILIERERFTQTRWDIEELRKLNMEMELKLKAVQDEKVRLESTNLSIVQENKRLLQELDVAKQQLEDMHKHREELELKSKADVKLLVKEVKSLRSSKSDLKQDLDRLMKEKIEVEEVLLKEKQRWEHTNSANTKLLHECEILRKRLEECSVNFLVEEDKLIMDTSSPSDTIDLLATSDSRIGLLLAEAQLLAEDVEDAVAAATRNPDGGHRTTTDEELRKLLADIFVDNARLRKQVNTMIRCTLNSTDKSEKDTKEEAH